MKRTLFLLAVLCIGFGFWLMTKTDVETVPIAKDIKAAVKMTAASKPPAKIQQPQPATLAKIERKKPALLQMARAKSFTEKDIERFLTRHRRSAEALAFAAVLYDPPNPKLIAEAKMLNPKSPAVIAADLQVLRTESLYARLEGNKAGSAKLQSRLAELVKADPKNSHYRIMSIYDMSIRADYSALTDTLRSIPKDLTNGNLAKQSREFLDGFLTIELEMKSNEAVRVVRDDKLTGPGVTITFQAVRDGLRNNQIPESDAAEMIATAIDFAQNQNKAGDDIYVYAGELESEIKFMETMSAVDGRIPLIEKYLSMPFSEYMADLRKEKDEAVAMRLLLSKPVTEVPEEFLRTHQNGEIQALQTWLNAERVSVAK